ncbi:adenylate/guanylate cyclase domain-containing protein [Domibacillus sp. 8LH]|uniref:adenylate/guanylate cyclase domain-containing protein n=1 Tax=Domibacillus sp. 8LH TaxID=3073900 RepID=UPI003181554C
MIFLKKGGTVQQELSAEAMLEIIFDYAAKISGENDLDTLLVLMAEMGVVIKGGLFIGPTIAVNANGLLDYFGHTVNMAARIQQQSEGGDIIVSAQEWERESFAGIAKEFSFSAKSTLKK